MRYWLFCFKSLDRPVLMGFHNDTYDKFPFEDFPDGVIFDVIKGRSARLPYPFYIKNKGDEVLTYAASPEDLDEDILNVGAYNLDVILAAIHVS